MTLLEEWTNQIICGDCLELMPHLPDGCVHCCVTSPPYYGLRDYGTAKWEGGDPNCDHNPQRPDGGERANRTLPLGRGGLYKETCAKCGAIRVDPQFGLEKTPEEYVSKMVEVFREVRRILHPTGTVWLNMGDSYASSGGSGSEEYSKRHKQFGKIIEQGSRVLPRSATPGLKPKDLLEMPSRLALALQADGWWLRSRIPWLKRNAMPESVQDRPTQAVEYVFLLSKSKNYFYDGEAVRVKYRPATDERLNYPHQDRTGKCLGTMKGGQHEDKMVERNPSGRSRRNSDWFFESWQGLWTDENGEPLAFIVNPMPYKQAHFATFPPGLVIPCLKAGTSEKGCCPECGAPWVRVISNSAGGTTGKSWHPHEDDLGKGNVKRQSGQDFKKTYRYGRTLGWRPTCSCGKESVPCIVIDPFMGSGTVAEVARKMGRRYLGFELNEQYVKDFCAKRLAQESLAL